MAVPIDRAVALHNTKEAQERKPLPITHGAEDVKATDKPQATASPELESDEPRDISFVPAGNITVKRSGLGKLMVSWEASEPGWYYSIVQSVYSVDSARWLSARWLYYSIYDAGTEKNWSLRGFRRMCQSVFLFFGLEEDR